VGFEQCAGLGVAALGVGGAALERRHGQAAAGDLLLTDVLGGGEVDAGLGLVGQPDHRRSGRGLGDGAQRGGPRSEVREGPGLITGRLRNRVHSHPHAGDHSEHAFGADEQLAQIRARRRRRGAPHVEHTGRGDRAQSAHHVVEAAVSGGVLT
jgi:hypothetical protein